MTTSEPIPHKWDRSMVLSISPTLFAVAELELLAQPFFRLDVKVSHFQ
jgi:hypothetical protein